MTLLKGKVATPAVPETKMFIGLMTDMAQPSMQTLMLKNTIVNSTYLGTKNKLTTLKIKRE